MMETVYCQKCAVALFGAVKAKYLEPASHLHSFLQVHFVGDCPAAWWNRLPHLIVTLLLLLKARREKGFDAAEVRNYLPCGV